MHAIGVSAVAKNHSSTIFKNVIRGVVALSVALAGLFATTAPASAHASTQMYGESATAGGYGAVFIRIPHAAAGLNTVKIEVQIPEGVTSVKPQRVAGWSESKTLAADGKTVASVIWDGGSLPDSSFADFGISVKFPAAAGTTLYFKTVQTLNDGSTVAWIEIPAAGVDAHSLAKPAPGLTLAAAAPAHGTMPEAGHMPETTTPVHTVQRWTGDVAVVLGSKLAKVTADVSSVHAGKVAEVRLVASNGKVSLLKGKLDSRGDIVKSIAKAQKGKITWSLKAGDKVELLVSGKVVAEATI